MTSTSRSGGAPDADRTVPRSGSPLRRLGTGGLALVLAASLYGCADAGTGSASAVEATTGTSGSGASAGETPDASASEDRGPDEAPEASDAVSEEATDEAQEPVRVAAPAEPGEPAVVEGGGTGKEERSTTETVALDEPVQPAKGLEIAVESTKAVQAEGMGPGGMSGPAITVVVTVRNATDSPVSTIGSSVTLTYGPDDRPGEPSRQPDDAGLPGEVAPGKTVSGTYTFLVPEDQREDVVITASYRATDPAAVFAGRAHDQGAGA